MWLDLILFGLFDCLASFVLRHLSPDTLISSRSSA